MRPYTRHKLISLHMNFWANLNINLIALWRPNLQASPGLGGCPEIHFQPYLSASPII